MNKFDKFLADNNNTFVERVDSTNRNQCFDLAIYWCEYLGLPKNIFSGLLNAYQIYTNPTAITKENFTLIPNTPTGIPQKGDIVVWSNKYGPAGHVGIATGTGDTKTFDCFEQNDPTGSNSHIKKYTYTAVLGWLRFKGNINSSDTPMENPDVYGTLVKKSTQFDKVCAYLAIPSDPKDVMFEDIQKVIAGIKSSDNSAKRQVQELGAQLAVTQQEVKNREEQVSRLKTQLTETIESYQIEIEALKNKPDETSELVTNLRAQVVSLEGKYEEAMKEKGSNLKDLAEAKKNLDICIKSGPPSKSLLDFILDLLKRVRVIS